MLALECILEKAANRLGVVDPVPASCHQTTDSKLERKKWDKEINKVVIECSIRSDSTTKV